MVFDDRGRWRWRFDLCYRDLKLIVEYDGVYRDPLGTLVRVHTALEELGAQGLPRRFKAERSRHFPGRG